VLGSGYGRRMERAPCGLLVVASRHVGCGGWAVLFASTPCSILVEWWFRGLIKAKVYGKVKLYFPDQAQYGQIKPEDLAALDAEAKVLLGSLTSPSSPPPPYTRTHA
jgi:hypothetical protein